MDDGCLITFEQHNHLIARNTAGYDETQPRQRMVTSCRAGQAWEEWWSTVPSIRLFKRVDGADMPFSVACLRR